MSRFSFSSSLSLFQSVTLTDSDATSSSTSSNSAINNSSGSLSLSPQSSSSGANPNASTIASGTTTTSNNNNNSSIAALLFERQAREPSKFANIKQLNNISNHLLELQREIKEEEEEIFADINSLINNRSNLYSSFDEDTDDLEDTLGGVTNTTASTAICTTHPFRATNSNNISGSSSSSKNKQHQRSDYFQEDEDQGLDQETDFLGEENVTQRHQYADETKNSGNNNIISSNLNNNINNHDHFNGEDYVLCNRVTGQQRQQQHLEKLSEQEQQEQHYLELVHEGEDKHHLHEQQQQQQHRHKDDDDDQDQQDQQQLDGYQAIQREDILQLTNNLPKPCVFFLEGNCRRSDCKYSHDLSSITCKYWIEGFCFKGEMCPFLHSFNQKGQVSSSLEDELALTRERLNPTFAIESEADFPSLPLDAPNVTLNASSTKEIEVEGLNIKNQILSSNPAVVFKTTKKKRKKG